MENKDLAPEHSFDRVTDLSPAEHALMGSSYMHNNELFNSEAFFDNLEHGRSEMFKPTGLFHGESLEEINKRRKQQGSVSGMLSFVEGTAQVDLSLEKGLMPTLFLDPFEPNSEKEQFRIGLVNQQGILEETSAAFDFLKNNLSERYKKYFDVKIENGEIYMVKK